MNAPAGLRSVALLALALGSAFAQTDAERYWREYVEWFRAQPAATLVPGQAYREHLQRAGVPRAEAERWLRDLERLAKDRRSELQAIFFDKTYSDSKPRFNPEPNALLAETIRGLKPGRALDIHMGQGRNAVFLAAQGWDVTGFDFSAEGVRAAGEAAKRKGVKLTAVVSRHEDFDFGAARWDLVVMSYTWVPLTSEWIDRIVASLAPGGVLVFEHLMNESGGSGAAPWIPRPNQLFDVFRSLRILRYEDARTRADWSWREERTARLVAQKARE